MLTKLTQAVLHYRLTGKGFEEAVRQASIHVYYYPVRHSGWDLDSCSEFFLYFRPRMIRMIERFEWQGKLFEMYLNRTLRFQQKTFASRRQVSRLKKKAMDTILIREYREQLSAAEWEPAYGKQSPLEKGSEPSNNELSITREQVRCAAKSAAPPVLKSRRNVRRFYPRKTKNEVIPDSPAQRRLVLLLLKEADRVDHDMIQNIAGASNIPARKLEQFRMEILKRMERRRSRYAHMVKRKNALYFELQMAEERLRYCETSQTKDRQRALCRDLRRQLDNLHEHINRLPLTPTHRDIATVLGIPKGSVDSGLYYIRNTFTEEKCIGYNPDHGYPSGYKQSA
ncbi:MAG: hypothetical protein K9L68_14155 [Spirochaetales bacterium]|nr:hypothetical protein [Spirochaetales bacterium]MCF7939736.1 hypothetical protein [Spirochaetales bacterium]